MAVPHPDSPHRADEARIGDALPACEVPITTTLIVEGALASQDLYPGHHDRDFAVAHGMPDVFMNILTTNGLVGRYLTDWAGSAFSLSRLRIRLGVPNVPGDVMSLTGEITARAADGGSLSVSFAGTNARGRHVAGDAELTRGAQS